MAKVQVRVDDKIQQEAQEVVESYGLSVSDVVRVLLTKISQEKVLPLTLFSRDTPNRETIEAMEAALRPDSTQALTVKEALQQLNDMATNA